MTDTFKAKDEAGAVHSIQEYTEFHDATSFADGLNTKWVAGLKSYQMSTGEKLNQKTPTEYATLWGEKITRI